MRKPRSRPRRRKSAPVALITGGTRGIGLAVAKQMAADGYSVVICGRDDKALARAASELERSGRQLMAIRCDVSHPAQVEDMFAQVEQHLGRLDVLVNNAGLSHPTTPVEKLAVSDWQRNLDVNLTGTFLCTKSALPLMSRGGTIINNLSVAIRVPFAGTAAYSASKAGVLGLTNVLRAELRERGIRVVALVPGPIATDLWEQFWPDAPREKMVMPATVAEVVAGIVRLPAEATVEEVAIGPTGGTL